jgi:hypothetical protein
MDTASTQPLAPTTSMLLYWQGSRVVLEHIVEAISPTIGAGKFPPENSPNQRAALLAV